MERLDPALMTEIENAKNRGLDMKKVKFKVIIQHKERIELSSSVKRERSLRELEIQAKQKLSSIISELDEIGASQQMKLLPFANSVYAELDYDQIIKISKMEDTKTIIPSKEEQITC